MLYKKNYKDVMRRQAAFWNRRMPEKVLARIYVKNPPFEGWLNEHGPNIPITMDGLPDKELVIDLWDHKLRNLAELEDDSLPVMLPNEFDEGLYAGVFGQEVIGCFDNEAGWFSSMGKPFLDDYSGLDELHLDMNCPILQELKSRLDYYRQFADGKFGLSPVITIDSLNLAVLLRGAQQAMMDQYDYPDELVRLFEFALEVNIKLLNYQQELMGSFENGTFDGYAAFGGWFEGKHVNISVDAYGMCSPEVFEKIGFNYSQRLIDAFGSGFLHIHGNAHHLLPQAVKLKGLKAIRIVDEAPHPFPRLREIKEITGDMPLLTDCMLDEFIEAMDSGTLVGGVFYVIRGHKEGRSAFQSPVFDTIDEADNLMEKIRNYTDSTV